MASGRRSKEGGGVAQTVRQHAGPGLSSEQLSAMTKEQLRVECRKRGQKSSGNKTELLTRLGYKSTSICHLSDKSKSDSDCLSQHQLSNGRVKAKAALAGGDSFVSNNRYLKMESENSLVLWKRPFTTLEYFVRETLILVSLGLQKLVYYKRYAVAFGAFCLAVAVSYQIKGPHQPLLQNWVWLFAWWLWWVMLGVLSSVGLGTGLHTFLLYLGPHIARVTLAAYECGAVNFPQPPYPDRIICPESIDPRYAVSIWSIMSKVRMESMMWGLGTALGELPPYFMARAARLSSKPLEELQLPSDDGSFSSRAKLGVQKLVEKVGFLGILACASIPNPLFDLAGLTCGHFLVPFWTFFGATLIGKAVIKMHLQKMFVIIAFNEVLVSQVLTIVEKVPVIGPKLEAPLLEFLKNQKTRLHSNGANQQPIADSPQGTILSNLLEKFVLTMVVYFVVSIINSLAQNYQKRLRSKKNKKRKD